MRLIIVLLCLFSFTNEIVLTSGKYQLQVTLHSFSNPDGRCAGVGCQCNNITCSGCCNSPSCTTKTCYYFFSICLRDRGTRVSYDRSKLKGNCNPLNSTPIFDPIRDGDNFTDTVYGLTNPIVFTGSELSSDGAQLYIEIIDSNSTDQLIDRFAINVISSTSTPKRRNYQGIFGFAEIEVSIGLSNDDANTATEENNRRNGSYRLYVITIVVITGTLLLLMLMVVTIISLVMFIRRRISKYKQTINDLHLVEIFHRNSEREEDRLQSNYISSTILDLDQITPGQGSQYSDYARLNRTPRDDQTSQNLKETPSVLDDSDNNTTIISSINGYESCHDLGSGENGPEPMTIKSPATTLQCGRGGYCFSIEDDEYDYSAPFFVPSNEERELVSQMKTLRMLSIPKEDLQEYEVLGSGAFGTVTRGLWKHYKADSEVMEEEEVAVKTIEDSANEEERVKFLQEAAIMGQFNHPDIIKILGILISENECKIVMELMPKGSLKDFLPTLHNVSEVSSKFLSYSRQIASACGYLAVKGYVHRDLAARNILISMEDTCKSYFIKSEDIERDTHQVGMDAYAAFLQRRAPETAVKARKRPLLTAVVIIGDFGLSRHLNKSDENFYISKGGKIPVKWTAPEAFLYRLWSTASDVWSYGCVLYEIWSLGVKPFSGQTNAEAIDKISNGYRLPPPPGCPRILYEVMIKCWNSDYEKRPTFCYIVSVLNRTENKILTWSEEDEVAYSKVERRIGAPLVKGNNLFLELQSTYMDK